MSSEEYKVGCVLELSEEAAAELSAKEKALVDLHTKLGVLFDEFEAAKAHLRREIVEARVAWHASVLDAGKALGANMGEGFTEDWEYIPEKKSFVRTK